MGASAIVIAGGDNAWTGRPRALLPFAGEPLIAHLVRQLRILFESVVVVAPQAQELPVLRAKIVRAKEQDRGPVVAICCGLKETVPAVSFVTSCSTPFLNVALVSDLVLQMRGCDVVVPRWNEQLQPLHAAYHPRVLPLLQEQLERGDLRLVRLFERVSTRKILEDEIRRFDPDGLSFATMNTPEDYENALKRWQELYPPAGDRAARRRSG